MELSVLQEASFGGPEADKVLELVDAGGRRRSGRRTSCRRRSPRLIFEDEEELGAVSVLIWMRIIAR